MIYSTDVLFKFRNVYFVLSSPPIRVTKIMKYCGVWQSNSFSRAYSLCFLLNMVQKYSLYSFKTIVPKPIIQFLTNSYYFAITQGGGSEKMQLIILSLKVKNYFSCEEVRRKRQRKSFILLLKWGKNMMPSKESVHYNP